MGEKSADNLLAGLEDAKARGMARVLAGLGIRHIGSSAAKTLARHYPDIDTLLAATVEELEALPDFGTIRPQHPRAVPAYSEPMNHGDTGMMMMATTFVMLQTPVPHLTTRAWGGEGVVRAMVVRAMVVRVW